MKTEFLPPYRAIKDAGHWFVMNALGGFETSCDCRHQAVDFANEMNKMEPSLSRVKAMSSQLSRGHVITKPFDPPSDETYIFPWGE